MVVIALFTTTIKHRSIPYDPRSFMSYVSLALQLQTVANAKASSAANTLARRPAVRSNHYPISQEYSLTTVIALYSSNYAATFTTGLQYL